MRNDASTTAIPRTLHLLRDTDMFSPKSQCLDPNHVKLVEPYTACLRPKIQPGLPKDSSAGSVCYYVSWWCSRCSHWTTALKKDPPSEAKMRLCNNPTNTHSLDSASRRALMFAFVSWPARMGRGRYSNDILCPSVRQARISPKLSAIELRSTDYQSRLRSPGCWYTICQVRDWKYGWQKTRPQLKSLEQLGLGLWQGLELGL